MKFESLLLGSQASATGLYAETVDTVSSLSPVSLRSADHSPPSSPEVKEWVELYLHSPNTPYGVVLS